MREGGAGGRSGVEGLGDRADAEGVPAGGQKWNVKIDVLAWGNEEEKFCQLEITKRRSEAKK